MSEEKRKSRNKHNTVRQYLLTPVVYVLISAVIVVPLCIALFGFTVSTFHKIQPSFSITGYDFELNDSSYTRSDVKSGTVTLPDLKFGDKVGELKIKSAGIDASVYYGRNILSHKYGAGLSSNEKLPGQNGTVYISANVATEFKSLKNLEAGDEISLNTSWGDYVYTVSESTTGLDAPDAKFPQTLMLYTENDDKVFSALNEEKLYVMAECKSGPQAEEGKVSYE